MRSIGRSSPLVVIGLALALPLGAAGQGLTTNGRGSGRDYVPPAGTPLTPHGQGGAGLIPPVEGQNDSASRAASAPASGPRSLLQAAGEAIGRSDAGLANEYLERAATALLNDPEITARDQGVRSVGPGREINEARAALARRDLAAARQHVDAALAGLRWASGHTGGDQPPSGTAGGALAPR